MLTTLESSVPGLGCLLCNRQLTDHPYRSPWYRMLSCQGLIVYHLESKCHTCYRSATFRHQGVHQMLPTLRTCIPRGIWSFGSQRSNSKQDLHCTAHRVTHMPISLLLTIVQQPISTNCLHCLCILLRLWVHYSFLHGRHCAVLPMPQPSSLGL